MNASLKAGLFLIVAFSAVKSEPEYLTVRGDFRSIASGPWSSHLTWEQYDGADWLPSNVYPDSGAGVITVRTGHTVTIMSSLVCDQVVVERGAEVVVAAGVSHTLADGPGIDLTIEGRWLNQGASWTIPGNARWAVNDGGVFIHNTTAGISTPLSKSILSPASTFVYRGGASLVPASTFSGRTYGHLRLESLGGPFTLNASGSGALQITGDLTIGAGVKWNTGGFSGNITVQGVASIAGEWGGSGSGNQGVHTFAGPFKLESGGKYTLATTGGSKGSLVFKGDVECASTFVTPVGRLIEFSGSIIQSVNASAKMVLSSGAVTLNEIMITAGSTVEIGPQKSLVLHGDLENSGTIAGTDSASSLLISDSSRTFVNNGSLLAVVEFDSTVADRHISGAGTWNAIQVGKRCTLQISGSHTLSGGGNPLTVLGKVVFENGSVIAYRGRSRQDISPQPYCDLVIENPEGARLSGPTTVNGRLTLRTGSLTTGMFSLQIGSNASVEETGASRILGTVTSTRRLVEGEDEDFGGIGIWLRPVSPFDHDINIIRRTDTVATIARSRPIRRLFIVGSGVNLRSALVSFRYDPSELNGAAENALQLYGSPDGGSSWNPLGGRVDTATHTVSYSGDCVWSLITIAEPFQPPRIVDVSPGIAEQGSSINLILSGSGFTEGPPILSIGGTGVKVNTVIVRSNSTLEANITVDVAAPLGARGISLETPGGETRILFAFEVVKARNPVPQLHGLAPSTGARLESLAVTFHGNGFVEGVTTVSLGDNIAVTSYVLDPTLLVVNASIDANASLGPRNAAIVNVAPGGGTATLAQAFSVINPMPSIALVSPRKAARGDRLQISVTGSNFISGVTSLDFGNGIVIDSFFVASPNLIKAQIRVEFSVDRGTRPLTVSNQQPGGGRGALLDGLVITDPPPRVERVLSPPLSRGSHEVVELVGSGFVPQGMILSLGSGVLVDSLQTIDSCRLRAFVFVPGSATPGPREAILANRGPDGESSILQNALIVVNPPPILIRVEPAVAAIGKTITISLSGKGLFPDASSLDFGPGITVKSCSGDSSAERLTATISVSAHAAVGQRDVKVINCSPGGGEAVLAKSFAIVNPAPSVLSIKPANGPRGGVLDIYVTGTSFVQGATTVSLSPGVTTDSVIVLSPELSRARISIGPAAVVGARTVVVTNAPPGGGIGRLMHVFNVENALPTIDRVEPAVVWRGEKATLVVRGSGFCPGITNIAFGGGFVIESTKVAMASVLEVTLSVTTSAELGVRDVRVTNASPGGGEAVVRGAFAVHNPQPAVEGINPSTGETGKAVFITITGSRFLQGLTTVSLGDGIEVDSLAIKDSQAIEGRISIHAAARAGPRSVTVSNSGPGGGIALLRDAFSVIAPLPSSADLRGSPIPTQPLLVGTYPNPFNNAVTVKYGLSERSMVRIVVRNILGVEVEEVLNEEQREGYHNVRWASTREPSGVYLIHLVAESKHSRKRFTASRKIILLK